MNLGLWRAWHHAVSRSRLQMEELAVCKTGGKAVSMLQTLSWHSRTPVRKRCTLSGLNSGKVTELRSLKSWCLSGIWQAWFLPPEGNERKCRICRSIQTSVVYLSPLLFSLPLCAFTFIETSPSVHLDIYTLHGLLKVLQIWKKKNWTNWNGLCHDKLHNFWEDTISK